MDYFDGLSTPVGRIHIVVSDVALLRVYLPGEAWDEEYIRQSAHPLIVRTKAQLREYFHGERTVFSLPIAFEGTRLQHVVWSVLQEVPFGETCAYRTLAARVGAPRAVRAVASAVGKNPLPIIVPCHRIIRADGSLGEYAGGVAMKRKLLDRERMLFTREHR
jgi:methylated-DNA-[protein]-cysteine S-methyltransferase